MPLVLHDVSSLPSLCRHYRLVGAAFAQTATPAPTVQFATVPADIVLSHSLIGPNVYNAVYKAADEKVSEIKDLVIAKDMLDG
jgi:hypothetical protein